ncbi:MAG TPA: acetoacetate decarboxylase family protein [Anaerolineales bacterium]|nr:acetoacetate decarboxylase family protein [Anaerolineales bacterium]
MMRLDPSLYYRMPLAMGAVGDRRNAKLVYPQVEVLAFQYLTDADALADLLPEYYQPGKEPLVTVIFSQNNGLSFMAGGGYRLAAFQLSARYDGKQDHLEGDYIVVMFEDNTWPIIGGREDLGVPKLYADISKIKIMPDGHLRCEASVDGHLLFGLDVPPLKRQIGLARLLAGRQINARPWFGHKYIPSLDGPPDANYPTVIYNVSKLEKFWLGKKASLRFGMARIEDIGLVKHLLDALATLIILRPIQVVHFIGSAVLRYDLSRRLL